MKNVLVINSSLFEENSQSARLAEEMVERLRGEHGELELVRRDLGSDPLPHLDAATFAAYTTPQEERSAEQKLLLLRSDRLVDELRRADFVVLGLPMYNFSVPSTLKAWFDHVARVGVTFRYTSDGPEGLLEDRPVYVMATRGGRYAGTSSDTQTGYVRQFLAFLGLRQVEFIYAEGLASSEGREHSLREAVETIQGLAA